MDLSGLVCVAHQLSLTLIAKIRYTYDFVVLVDSMSHCFDKPPSSRGVRLGSCVSPARSSLSTLDALTDVPRDALGSSRAQAQVNIALIKYWGKSEADANLPAVGSLSLTLDSWGSETRLSWVPREAINDLAERDMDRHVITLNDRRRSDDKITRLLDQALMVAARRGHSWAHPDRTSAIMVSRNSVPTASGLASSASGMAALGVAAWAALGYERDLKRLQSGIVDEHVHDLIDLVRIGSGSAVRSLLGGVVRLERDGRSARTLCDPESWDLALVVGVVDPGPKAISSREGMERTRRTSPYYQAWVDTHAADLDAAEEAVRRQDLEQLGELMEHSTFKMHASMWTSRPPLRYLKGASLDILDQVEQLRAQGVSAWATMDAGPHVKVLCHRVDAPRVARTLSDLPRLSEVVTRYPGRAAHVMK